MSGTGWYETIERSAVVRQLHPNRADYPHRLEVPLVIHGLDSPLELLAKGLGEDFLKRYIELLAEDHTETRIDVILLDC